ncbi:hypothetical protein [Mythimna sequax nucleopolyhedrovirus]|nr:hypothetical protein [Mythimna sequax nucleopolyhedrovirus]
MVAEVQMVPQCNSCLSKKNTSDRVEITIEIRRTSQHPLFIRRESVAETVNENIL